jgi:hypothetical protein
MVFSDRGGVFQLKCDVCGCSYAPKAEHRTERNIVDESGWTPFYFGVKHRCTSCIENNKSECKCSTEECCDGSSED